MKRRPTLFWGWGFGVWIGMWLVSFRLKAMDEPDAFDEDAATPEEIIAFKKHRFGAILMPSEEIVDLTAALPSKWQPLDALEFLRRGDDAFRRADEVIRRGEFRVPLSECTVLAPITNPGVVVSLVDNVEERARLAQEREAELAAERELRRRAKLEGMKQGEREGEGEGEGKEGKAAEAVDGEHGVAEDEGDGADATHHNDDDDGAGASSRGKDGLVNESGLEESEGAANNGGGGESGVKEGGEDAAKNGGVKNDEKGKEAAEVMIGRAGSSGSRAPSSGEGREKKREQQEKPDAKVQQQQQQSNTRLPQLRDDEPPAKRVPIFYTKYILGVYGSKSFVPIIEGGSYWPGVQLAIVIGSECRRANKDEAKDFIAGMCVCCDFAVNDWDKNESKWLIAKAYDAPLLVGPALLALSAVQDMEAIKFKISINGDTIMEAGVCDLVDGIPELVSHVSKFITLQPGDLILTGSPHLKEGKEQPKLQPGDVIVCYADEIGEVSCTIVDDTAIE